MMVLRVGSKHCTVARARYLQKQEKVERGRSQRELKFYMECEFFISTPHCAVTIAISFTRLLTVVMISAEVPHCVVGVTRSITYW